MGKDFVFLLLQFHFHFRSTICQLLLHKAVVIVVSKVYSPTKKQKHNKISPFEKYETNDTKQLSTTNLQQSRFC